VLRGDYEEDDTIIVEAAPASATSPDVAARNEQAAGRWQLHV